MSEVLSNVEPLSDAELISRVRGGDTVAYGELFARHVEAARRLGRQLASGADADDLVSDAFAKVLQALQRGGGPDVAFRAYLLTAVRRLHVDRIRAGSRLQPSDDMSKFDPGVPFQDTAVQHFENAAAAKAFASLPERWQLVLWHLEVERQRPAEVAPLLGMSANSVSALAYRAREGLRQAFLTMHSADTASEQCRWTNDHLGAYVRKGLSRRDNGKVKDHIEHCRRCTAVYLELTEVNSDLSAIIAPLLLGGAATGYVAATTGGAAAATGLLGFAMGRARDLVVANAQAAVTGAVAAGVAGATVAGVVVVHGRTPQARLDAGTEVVGTQTPGASASAGGAGGVPGAPGATPERRDGGGESARSLRQGMAMLPVLPGTTSSSVPPGVSALLPPVGTTPGTTPDGTGLLGPTDAPTTPGVPTASTTTGQPGDGTTTASSGQQDPTPAGTPTGGATTEGPPVVDSTPDLPTPTGDGTTATPTETPTDDSTGTPGNPPTHSTPDEPVAADFSVTLSTPVDDFPFAQLTATVAVDSDDTGAKGLLTFDLSPSLKVLQVLAGDGCDVKGRSCEVTGGGQWLLKVLVPEKEVGTLTATVTASSGYSDGAPGNNSFSQDVGPRDHGQGNGNGHGKNKTTDQ